MQILISGVDSVVGASLQDLFVFNFHSTTT